MIEIAKLGIRKVISIGGLQKKLPMHLAVGTGSLKDYSEKNKKDIKETVKFHFEKISELLDYQIKNEIRVLTLNLTELSPELIAEAKAYFASLSDDGQIHKNQVRIFFIGQWYETDYDLSDVFKLCMEKTKMYDNFFLNFCVNYDGREEILGATRLMIRKILAGKLKEEDITEAMVKENLYTSYFPPPELIIETRHAYSGTLLWDSEGSVLYFSEKEWPLFGRKELEEAISFYDNQAGAD